MKKFKVPIAYERYGYLEIEAEDDDAAIKIANDQLQKMSLSEMESVTAYLPDSEEVDEEGIMEIEGSED